MKKRFVLILILLGISISSLYGSQKTMEIWKDQILYFILIDRFFDGDLKARPSIDKNNIYAFHGGNIKGVIKKVDYLKELGITGVWLSPFFKNRPGKFFKHYAYHGYWVWNFWKPDERFSSMEDLKELRRVFSANGLRFLLDMVVNHMDYNAPFVDEHESWFHKTKNISNWNDKKQLENYKIFGLPDFASEKPIVRKFFKAVGKYWIDEIQPDGFRLDAVKHVPTDFWKYFNSAVKEHSKTNFLTLGELMNGDPAEVADTIEKGKFSSMFDYPLYYTMKEVFAKGKDCRILGSRLYEDRKYPDAGLLATFLDNHDLDRFLTSCSGNMKKYKLALAFLLTARGIPTLTYGNEAGLMGEESPEPTNRSDMKFDTSTSLFKYVKQLIKLRKESVALRRGIQCHLYMDAELYSFARLTKDEAAIFVMNNSSKAKEVNVLLPFNVNAKVLKDKLNKIDAVVKTNRLITYLPAKSCAIYFTSNKKDQFIERYDSWKLRAKNESAWGMKKVTFKLRGENIPLSARVFLTGSSDYLGNWSNEIGRAHEMKQISKGEFEVQVKLPIGSIFECKSFFIFKGKEHWQKGNNYIGHVSKTGGEYIFLSEK